MTTTPLPLAEQLAKRFFYLTGKVRDQRTFDSIGHDLKAEYMALGIEAARQMEWAKTHWTARVDSAGSEFYSDIPGAPLTLAPTDWTPAVDLP